MNECEGRRETGDIPQNLDQAIEIIKEVFLRSEVLPPPITQVPQEAVLEAIQKIGDTEIAARLKKIAANCEFFSSPGILYLRIRSGERVCIIQAGGDSTAAKAILAAASVCEKTPPRLAPAWGLPHGTHQD